jgi:mRNA-degrading endonuclease RelE of RelBE toxin-antitoxin system
MYNVIISKTVTKYLTKLPKSLASIIYTQINKLRTDKSGYRCLQITRPYELRELRIANYRIYYLVTNAQIIVDLITYDGKIDVVDAGTKISKNAKLII